MSKRTIKGKDLQGTERTYTFELMTQKRAFQLFHEFSAEIQLMAPMIVGNIIDDKKEEPGEFDALALSKDALRLIECFPMVLSWDRIVELNKFMLANCTIQTGDEIITMDKQGFGGLDPIGSYMALFYAIIANYEPLVAPLLVALGEQGEKDTSQPIANRENK
jgi:hypothetical protein